MAARGELGRQSGASGATRLVLGLAMLLGSCATQSSIADRPSFNGSETEWWLVQETGPVGRDDILPAFEASASNYGCSTTQLGTDSSSNIHGELRTYYGVSASCDEGTIALITMAGGGVRIGCAKPTTRKACDGLLRRISRGR